MASYHNMLFYVPGHFSAKVHRLLSAIRPVGPAGPREAWPRLRRLFDPGCRAYRSVTLHPLGLIAAGFGIALLSGCYTQFATLSIDDGETAAFTDTAGEALPMKVDTIRVERREVCYWTRDYFGRPRLRCFESDYSRDWFTYYRSPWWYRHDPYWFDYDHCPRYYYYDPSCGCCRYYRDPAYPWTRRGASGRYSGKGGPPPSHGRAHGVPDRGDIAGQRRRRSTGMSAGGGGPRQPSDTGRPEKASRRSRRSRSYGVEEAPSTRDTVSADGLEKKNASPSGDSAAGGAEPQEKQSPAIEEEKPDSARTAPRPRERRRRSRSYGL